MIEPEEESEESSKLPDYYLAELREAFDLFHDVGINMISTDNLFRLMQILGVPANVDDHRFLLHKYDPDGTGNIDFKSCEEIMSEKWDDVDPHNELTEAFSNLDDSGYIQAKELRKIMSTFGNPLNKKELGSFMKQATINEKGYICWDDYVALLNPNRFIID